MNHIRAILDDLKGVVHSLERNPPTEEKAIMNLGIRNKIDEQFNKIKISISKIAREDGSLSNLINKAQAENATAIEKLEQIISTQKQQIVNSLENIESNEQIKDHILQIQVLSQYDSTASGFENCGYHALKNALISLLPDTTSGELNLMFQKKELFDEFYNHYCLPAIPKEAKIGHRDASVTILREIIQNIIKDDDSPPHLVQLKNALQKAVAENTLAIMPVTTTTGDDMGSPMLGFFDISAGVNGKNLVDLAKNPGPGKLSCVIGNELAGHWYTITIHKTENGELKFFGCDSAENHHQYVSNSFLQKTCELLLVKMQDPLRLLKECYEPISNFTAPKAGWFEADRFLSDEKKNLLMDDSRGELGDSNLERNVLGCLKAFEFVKSTEIISSTDYWIQLQIQDLETIVDFYAQQLPVENPSCHKMSEILSYIRANKPDDIVRLKVNEALQDLESMKEDTGGTEDAISPVQYERFRTTFTHMHTLYLERLKIANSENRLTEINRKGVLGVEPGLLVDGSPNAFEKSVKEKMNLLLLTFDAAKDRNELRKMIERIGSGDPCLTGRMSRVNDLYSEMQKIAEEPVDSKLIDLPVVCSLNNIITNMTNSHIEIWKITNTRPQIKEEVAYISAVTIEMLNTESCRDNFSTELRIFGSGEAADPFRQFLIEKGIINSANSNEIDWKAVAERLLMLPDFTRWLDMGKEMAIAEAAM